MAYERDLTHPILGHPDEDVIGKINDGQHPPHHDAVASGSELAPPLPPEDFHPQSIAHAGRTVPPPAAARRWLGLLSSSLARRADPACCARPAAVLARAVPAGVVVDGYPRFVGGHAGLTAPPGMFVCQLAFPLHRSTGLLRQWQRR
jgi:hypothetical protein